MLQAVVVDHAGDGVPHPIEVARHAAAPPAGGRCAAGAGLALRPGLLKGVVSNRHPSIPRTESTTRRDSFAVVGLLPGKLRSKAILEGRDDVYYLRLALLKPMGITKEE
ncbi:TPA: hypothetical protein EYP38_01375, partial [Candidatus Micrarchaeota archaeon]|nr:hypothetical protein [Candidatus Micrarchaeota archaeon]